MQYIRAMSDRRNHVLAGALACALISALAWLALRTQPTRPAVGPAESPAAAASAQPALQAAKPASGAAGVDGLRAAVGSPAASSHPAVAAERDPKSPGNATAGAVLVPSYREVCGIGTVAVTMEVSEDGSVSVADLPVALGTQARQNAWERVLVNLDSSGSERDRANALVLRIRGADGSSGRLELTESSQRALHELASLAAHTGDADVLHSALSECRLAARPPACDALSAAELTRLAPQDGSHWLMLAAADPELRAEAVQRAAASRRFGSAPSVVAAVDAAIPADLPPYLRVDLLMRALSIDHARASDLSISVLNRACGQGALPRADCASLADAMEAGTDSLLGFAIARALGKTSGWSPERIQASYAQQSRWETAIGDAYHQSDQPYSCDSVQQFRSAMLQRASQGELGLLKASAR